MIVSRTLRQARVNRQDRGRGHVSLGAVKGHTDDHPAAANSIEGVRACRTDLMQRPVKVHVCCKCIGHVCCSQLEASHCMACLLAVCALVSLSYTYVLHTLRS